MYLGTPSGGKTTFKMASIKLSLRKWSVLVVVESDGEAFTCYLHCLINIIVIYSKENVKGSNIASISQGFKLASMMISYP